MQTYTIPPLLPRDPLKTLPPVIYVTPISTQSGLPTITDVRTVSAQQWVKRPASLVLLRAERDAMVVRQRTDPPPPPIPPPPDRLCQATATATGIYRVLKGLPAGELLWFTGQCVETVGGCILAMVAEREDDGSMGPTHLIVLPRDSSRPAITELLVHDLSPLNYSHPFSRTICPVTGLLGEVTGRRRVTLYNLVH